MIIFICQEINMFWWIWIRCYASFWAQSVILVLIAGSDLTYVKHKVETIDEANLSNSYSLIEGDTLGDKLEKICYETKLVPSPDGGCIIKTVSKYHTKGDVEIKEDDVKYGKEKASHLFKIIENYLNEHRDTYN